MDDSNECATLAKTIIALDLISLHFWQSDRSFSLLVSVHRHILPCARALSFLLVESELLTYLWRMTDGEWMTSSVFNFSSRKSTTNEQTKNQILRWRQDEWIYIYSCCCLSLVLCNYQLSNIYFVFAHLLKVLFTQHQMTKKLTKWRGRKAAIFTSLTFPYLLTRERKFHLSRNELLPISIIFN